MTLHTYLSSSANLSSKSNLYWNPEQPPLSTQSLKKTLPLHSCFNFCTQVSLKSTASVDEGSGLWEEKYLQKLYPALTDLHDLTNISLIVSSRISKLLKLKHIFCKKNWTKYASLLEKWIYAEKYEKWKKNWHQLTLIVTTDIDNDIQHWHNIAQVPILPL